MSMSHEHEHERPVWFRLVDRGGHPYKGTMPAKVTLSSNKDVFDFLKKVREENPNLLSSLDAPQFKVYRNKAALDSKGDPLKPSSSFRGFGTADDEENCLIVVLLQPEPEYGFSTLGDVLALVLPPAKLLSTSTQSRSTNHSVYGRDLVNTLFWSTFESDVRNFIQSLDLKRRLKPPLMVEGKLFIHSEENVAKWVDMNVLRLLESIDGDNLMHYNPFSSPDFLGRPDFGVVDQSSHRLFLLFELKCPWVINSDVDFLKPKTEKAKHILAQLNGYMYLNNISYGVISTYCRWWFVKRVSDNDLLITRHYNDNSTKPTILECVYYMMMVGRATPQKLPITTREVAITLKTGGKKTVVFEERIYVGNYSDVWKIKTCPEGLPSVFKMIEKKCCKRNEAADWIDDEIKAYEKLRSLQGLHIPTFQGFGSIGSILYGFMTSYEGESVTWPLNEAEQQELRFIVGEMHKLGIAHGDIRFPNIVRNMEGKVKLIDFGRAKPASQESMKQDWEDLEKLFKKPVVEGELGEGEGEGEA